MEAVLTAKERERMERRELVRAKNEPPRLTLGEEMINTLSHALGAGLAIAAMVLLLLKSESGLEIMASCFYGISMVVMMLMSSVLQKRCVPSGCGYMAGKRCRGQKDPGT